MESRGISKDEGYVEIYCLVFLILTLIRRTMVTRRELF